ncbi:class I SAM-dependent methyltransferase [Paenibacillus sp. P26]|nr:class I SAM-dependent methyltransferase [Paenibacillus sp. P26]UUZ96177.1 class I SAM-dependent methyltransferase [Paenibacillus sp. P25]
MVVETKQRLAQAYDADAVRRSQSAVSDWKIAERDAFLNRLAAENKSALLEIGAGTGKDSRFFHDKGLSVKCIDLSPEMIRLCREKGLDTRVMDFYSLDFEDESFDAVYALNCLLHVPKAELGTVMEEIRRVLRPDGLFFMGLYGGIDSEGVWDKDWCEPKRFFAMYSDRSVQSSVTPYFALQDFHTVPLVAGEPHFQSLTLRKTDGL